MDNYLTSLRKWIGTCQSFDEQLAEQNPASVFALSPPEPDVYLDISKVISRDCF